MSMHTGLLKITEIYLTRGLRCTHKMLVNLVNMLFERKPSNTCESFLSNYFEQQIDRLLHLFLFNSR